VDLTTIIIVACFVLYGIIVYRRRESGYRQALHRLARGGTPAEKPVAPALWRLVTLASVTVLLFVFVAGCVALLFLRGFVGAGPTLMVGGACAFPLLILVLIFLRDLREYRLYRQT